MSRLGNRPDRGLRRPGRPGLHVDAAYPQFAWQIANDRSGWSSRRMPIGGNWGTTQPAAASINGEVDLLTYWHTGGMQEAILR